MNTITVKRSHFGGMVYAECECGYTCHYWEEPEELEHECKERGGFGNESACANCGDEWSQLDEAGHCGECAAVFAE